MRGLIALCVGLVVVLGAGAADAGVNDSICVACECKDGRFARCEQGDSDFDCQEACGGEHKTVHEIEDTLCTQVPGCPQFNNRSAPTASPYGIAALLVALGGFGAWRLRKRATA